jgi:hypothetical protein
LWLPWRKRKISRGISGGSDLHGVTLDFVILNFDVLLLLPISFIVAVN